MKSKRQVRGGSSAAQKYEHEYMPTTTRMGQLSPAGDCPSVSSDMTWQSRELCNNINGSGVRTGSNGFGNFGNFPNPKPDLGYGSPKYPNPNPEPWFGPEGFGFAPSSEPNFPNTSLVHAAQDEELRCRHRHMGYNFVQKFKG